MPKLSAADQAAKVSTTEARRRKEVALARLRELEVAEREGKLIAAEAVESRWRAIAGKIGQALDRIPSRCAQAAHAARDQREAEKAIAAEVRTIRRELSDELRAS